MQDIIDKKKRELLKEGLNYIDSWEKYIKDKPEIEKKYEDKKVEKLIDFRDEYSKYKRLLNHIKSETINNPFIEYFDNTFKEIKNDIETFKPKVFLERENLRSVCDIVSGINEMSKLPDQNRINYVMKCNTYFRIELVFRINYSLMKDPVNNSS